MFDKYRDYFDIDPEYFPQVNKELIEENFGRNFTRMKHL